jgi:hypothetical protein
MAFYHYPFYLQGIKKPNEGGSGSGRLILTKGLGIRIEGRYRTHSPFIPMMPLEITSSGQIRALSPLMSPWDSHFMLPRFPYLQGSYLTGPQFEGFQGMQPDPF